MRKNVLLAVSMVVSFGAFASVPKTNNHGFVIETRKVETISHQAKVTEENVVVEKKKSKPAVKKGVAKDCLLETSVETSIDENIKVTVPTKEVCKKELKKEMRTSDKADNHFLIFWCIILAAFFAGVIIFLITV